MLRILGSARRLCDGWTRREMLRAGGLSLFGLPWSSLLHLRQTQAAAPAASRPGSFGKAKACILLYLYGAPSQLETFDLKPDAPTDVRSQFKPIATSVPGLHICEHLPLTARLMHHTTLVRSMSHPYNIHSAAYTLTGVPKTDIPMELNPRDGRHWPFFGSVLDYLHARGGAAARRDIPGNVALPWRFSSRAEPFRRGGPYGGFLGAGYDPVCAEFQGDAPKTDPYLGVTLQGRFQFGLPGAVVDLDQLNRRRSLLQQLEDRRSVLDEAAQRGYDRHQSQVFSLLASPRFRRALDLSAEPVTLRERYGLTLFGQGALAARRLIEHGVQLVTVIWDEYREANSAWDTHNRQITRLKDGLLPGFDRAYSALLTDLHNRGLLEDTLVLCLSEHGRTPKLNTEPGGGRDHWSQAYCGLFAGGGIRQGAVLGASDRIAAFPKEHPVSPKDVLCTIYHLLGVDPHHTHLADREGRPVPLVAEGQVLTGLLA
jgi:hypothetical protein